MTKQKDSQKGGLRLLLITIASFIAMGLLCSAVVGAVMLAGDIDINRLGPEDMTGARKNWFRLTLLLINLLLFAGTALLALWIHYRGGWARAAGLVRAKERNSVGYAVLFFVISLPVVAYLAFLNLPLPLPVWVLASEETTNRMLENVLAMDSFSAFLLTLLTLAVTPALGEELLLRGVIQRRLFGEWFGNHHAAIWTTAVLFSAMHFEFAGFLPRMALGATLGYAYYWTSSLWVPILLHFLFNGFQVSVAYITGEFTPDTEMTDVPPWWLALIGLVLTAWIWTRAEGERRLD